MPWIALAQTPLTSSSTLDKLFADRDGAAVVLGVKDGKVLALHNAKVLTQRVATPGSAIKPFVLELLLDGGLSPKQRVVCHRPLHVAGHELNCSHPAELTIFNAEEALAYSCNSYFVTAASQLQQGRLEDWLRRQNFTRPSGLLPDEGEGRIIVEHSLADRQLLAVGAVGIQVTPMELASAYLRLAHIDPQHASAAQQVVLAGLRGATEYGIAQGGRPANISVAGKTGTAADPGNPQTHAWFAGFAPADHPQIVVVVFLEHGRGGAEAANIARVIFETYAEHRL